jgi:type IV pilus assembly protein PilB
MVARALTLKQIILAENLIAPEKYANLEIQARQLGKQIEQILVDSGIVTKQKLLQMLSTKWNVKAVDLDSLELDEEATRMIPETTARRYTVLPFSKAENNLYTAMSKPWDLTAIEDLNLRTGYNIKPYLAMPSDIHDSLNKVFTPDSKLTDYISSMSTDMDGAKTEEDAGKREEISLEKPREDDEKQARQIANAIILECVSRGASDIHIEPFEKVLLIRYRIDGQLHKSSFNVSKPLLNAVMARLKIMTNTMNITEKRLPQDGRIQITVQGRPIEFRVNTIPTAYGESCVMRILDRASIKVELHKLGFLEETFNQLTEVIKKPYGIILVCGPTGSGKSTTLYSALNYLLQESKKLPDGKIQEVSPKKILTAENPVEYDLAEVVQLPVKQEIGLTFAEAMRAFLRQDPDIIMIGEIRDRETAQIAMEAALTGHLVLSTIHTNDAPTAVSRLAEMQVPPYLISSAMEAVLAQRLIRTVCPACSQKLEKIHPKLQEEFDKLNLKAEDLDVRIGTGCENCSNTGYKGRSGIHELLIFDSDIRELLMSEIGAGPIRNMAVGKGMRLLWQDGIAKIAKGITTYEELLRVSQ